MSIQYRIAWKSIHTGYQGGGQFCLTLENAKAWLKHLKESCPHAQHWIEDESGDVVMVTGE